MLRLRTLGALAITRDGALLDFPSVQRRRLAFLAVLACAGADAPISRDRLMLLFWPERDEDQARNALKQLTFAIRHHLGTDELFLGASELRLNPAVMTSDVGELLEAHRRKELDTVARLYGGPFLDGIHLDDVPEFERWVDSQRERIAQLYRDACRSLAASAESRGDWPAAIVQWRALAAHDPLDASTARHLVAALAKSADVPAALRYARSFEKLLETELGVGIDDELRVLVDRLHATNPPAKAATLEPNHPRSYSAPEATARANVAATSPYAESYDAAAGAQRADTRRLARKHAMLGILLVALVSSAGLLLRAAHSAPEPRATDAPLIAVLPFDVDASDSSVAFLREGMPDLIDAAVAAVPGVRMADQHAVISAMRDEHVGDGRNPLAVADKLRFRLGAHFVVTGTIVGTARNLIVNLRTVDVAHDREASAVRVTGPIDSLAKLADRLAISLLARTATNDEPRLTDLSDRSLPVLRAYLAGRVAYRQGRLQEAVDAFRAALHLDSTFALAALGIAAAGGWTGTSLEARDLEDFQLGWKLRARLPPPDQALFDAYVGPQDPSTQTDAQRLAAWEHAYSLFPDRAEVAYEYGDRLFHVGGYLGIPNSDERAGRAFEQAVALDSGFYLPLAHLVELAARRGDAAAARRLLALYETRDSTADAATFLRWQVAIRQSDPADLAAVRRRIPLMPLSSLTRLISSAQYDALALDDADLALQVLMARQLSPSNRAGVLRRAHDLDINRGRVREAEAALRELRSLAAHDSYWAVAFGDAQQLQIFDALFSIGDTSEAAKLVATIEEHAVQQGRHEYPSTRAADACATELWRLSRRDARHTTETLQRLRASAAQPDSATYYGWNPQLCIAMIEALWSDVSQAPEAPSRLEKLDSLMMAGPHQFGFQVGNLLLARLFERRGDYQRGLRALRRRWREVDDGPPYVADAIALEANLSRKVGDGEREMAAIAKYHALRGATIAERPLR